MTWAAAGADRAPTAVPSASEVSRQVHGALIRVRTMTPSSTLSADAGRRRGLLEGGVQHGDRIGPGVQPAQQSLARPVAHREHDLQALAPALDRSSRPRVARSSARGRHPRSGRPRRTCRRCRAAASRSRSHSPRRGWSSCADLLPLQVAVEGAPELADVIRRAAAARADDARAGLARAARRRVPSGPASRRTPPSCSPARAVRRWAGP